MAGEGRRTTEQLVPRDTGPSRTVSTTFGGGGGESRVRIGQLSLQIPGVSADAGQRVVRRVSELVAARIPAGLHGEIDGLSLDVRAPARSGEDELVRAVADAIVRATSRSKGGF